MYTKLKLKIELFNDVVSSTSGKESDGFFIKLTVLDKDERFEGSNDERIGSYIRYGGLGFSIKSNINKPFGALNTDSLILPKLDRLGYAYTKYFETDKDRYNYTKLLYQTINDWSNYWWGFSEDSKSKILIKDNIWEVVCEKTNKFIFDEVNY